MASPFYISKVHASQKQSFQPSLFFQWELTALENSVVKCHCCRVLLTFLENFHQLCHLLQNTYEVVGHEGPERLLWLGTCSLMVAETKLEERV